MLSATRTPSPLLTTATTTTLLLLFLTSPASPLPMGMECYPVGMQGSCLRGCLSCWDAFGGELYDMAACCKECRKTQAFLIDQGPTRCSMDHVQKSWLKRFG
ncbi:uncharacterized protein LOC143296435 [Babylonia areolata]|uniref:uncharacterized protein LOC143296435 n=1 Tax=Babylonia areolata TaxID=304850 RepID=UPI003FCF18DE